MLKGGKKEMVKTNNKKIKKSVKKIREECDEIEDEIEDKKGTAYGDPIVKLY